MTGPLATTTTSAPTRAASSTDGGYDLKSGRTTLVRAVAEDNKRNFRFWAKDTVVTGCTAARPHRRGGAGAAAQVWLAKQAEVVLTGCTLLDGDTTASRPGKRWPTPARRVHRLATAQTGGKGSIVFQLEAEARLTVVDSTVRRGPGSRLSVLESGAHLGLPASVR